MERKITRWIYLILINLSFEIGHYDMILSNRNIVIRLISSLEKEVIEWILLLIHI
jgi:hypothetical protein